MEKTVSRLKVNLCKELEDGRISVKIILGDDCRNGHCDWSVTGDVLDGKYSAGGCIHEEILRYFPELAPVVRLHLCAHDGVPMYPVENGMYYAKRDRKIFKEYLRITDAEADSLMPAVAANDGAYFKYLLFSLGIVARWAKEAADVLAQVEKMAGVKWKNPYTPEQERFRLILTDEERTEVEEKIAAGYYTAEAIRARIEGQKAAKIEKKRREIEADAEKEIEKIRTDAAVKLALLNYFGPDFDNFIYYDHRNALCFNWLDYRDKITREQFDQFTQDAAGLQLPEGITFEFGKK